MNTRDQMLAGMTSEELVGVMAETSDRIKWCKANLDIGHLLLHSRWMDALLDEWLRRSGSTLDKAS